MICFPKCDFPDVGIQLNGRSKKLESIDAKSICTPDLRRKFRETIPGSFLREISQKLHYPVFPH